MGKVYEALLRAETDEVERRSVGEMPGGVDTTDENAPTDAEVGNDIEDIRTLDSFDAVHSNDGWDDGWDDGSDTRGVSRYDYKADPARSVAGAASRGKAADPSQGRHFSFLRYSLGTGSIYGGRQASAALARRAPANPAREATIDFNRLDPHLSVLLGNDRRVAEQFNKLALTLISRAAERGLKRVFVASANHGEGRTTVALNLAGALARARQRVLVVECDILRPALLKRLGLSCEIGIAEAFAGKMEAGSAVIRVRPFGFEVLPCRKPLENPVELLAAPGFWRMLQRFDANHDFILFDSSPLLEMGDASLLTKFTDTTLMVVQSGAVTTAEMARAVSPFTPENVLGVVMNRMKAG